MKFNTKNVIVIILSLTVTAILIFIWGNSFMDRQQSHMRSEAVLQVVEPIVEAVAPLVNSSAKELLSEKLIRKCAHFLEFSALAASLTLLFRLRRPLSVQLVFNCLSLGLMTAVADESIQILSNRGAMVQDILLDFCGVCTGCSLMLITIFIAKKLFTKR